MNAAPATRPRGRTRRAVGATLARLSVRERLVLSLLLLERMRPAEVAVTLRISLRQVERTCRATYARLDRVAGRARLSHPLRRAA